MSQHQPAELTAEESLLLQTLKIELSQLASEIKEDALSRLTQRYNLDADSADIKKFFSVWEKKSQNVQTLLDAFSSISLTFDWQSIVRSINRTAGMLRTEEFPDILSKYERLKILTFDMAELINNLMNFKSIFIMLHIFYLFFNNLF